MAKEMNRTEVEIIKAANTIFVEKGYEETTIQDIMVKVKMSKGAIYHYFKSKEEIFDAMWSSSLEDCPWYADIFSDRNLTGCEKVEKLLTVNLCNPEKQRLDALALPLLKNPMFLARSFEVTFTEVVPYLTKIIEDGIADGSIKSEHPSELAQVILLLSNFWINPAILPSGLEEIQNKCAFLCDISGKMGLTINTDKVLESIKKYYNALFKDDNA
ncbi:MAG: TetR/AcrR family transcriptional regulator [Oscillospiraceae bacterium]